MHDCDELKLPRTMFCRVSPVGRCLELRVRLLDTRNGFGGVYNITNQSETKKIFVPQVN